MRKFSNIDFFLKILPLKDDELTMPEMKKQKWGVTDFVLERTIQSVIILVINKSDSRCAVIRFCYHSYDYRPNLTALSPITITNCIMIKGVRQSIAPKF